MNPPFSVAAHVEGRVADAALRHIASALARLAEGGRLVAITGASLSPDNPAWRDAFVRLQERGRVVFSAADRRARLCPPRHDGRHAPDRHRPRAGRRSESLSGVAGHGARCGHAARLGDGSRFRRALPVAGASHFRDDRASSLSGSQPASVCSRARLRSRLPPSEPAGTELAYETVDWKPAEGGRITDALYEGYALQSIRIAGAQAASDPARAVGGDGLGRAAQALLSAASAGRRRRRRPPVRRPARKRHLCRRGPCRPSRRIVDRR